MQTESKTHLRDFQERLSERLRQAGSTTHSARLGLAIGDQRWLVDLAEAGEIVPIPAQMTPVPLTRDWFRGLVNLGARCSASRTCSASPATRRRRCRRNRGCSRSRSRST